MKKRKFGYGSLAVFMVITDLIIIIGLMVHGVPVQRIGSVLFVIGMCGTFAYIF